MKKNWLYNISDEELSRLLKKDFPEKEVPYFLDNKLLNIIKNKEEITQKQKKNFINNLLKYSLSFSVLAVFIFIAGILTSLFIDNKSCIVLNVEGNVYEKKADGKTKKTAVNSKIKENKKIITEERSKVYIKAGSNTFAEIKENSSFYFKTIFRNKNTEKNDLYLKKGFAFFNVNLPSKDSIFRVQSDILEAEVTGTKFNFIVSDDKTTKVETLEGNVTVKIKPEINDEIKNRVYKKFELDFIIPFITVKTGESFELNYKDYKDCEVKLEYLIKLIEEDLNKPDNPKINKQKIEAIQKKIVQLLDDLLLKNKSAKDKNKIKFITEKLNNISKTGFPEKHSAVTQSGNNILITSAFDKTIYLVDSDNGNLKWKLKSDEINSITAPAYFYENEILLSTPDHIFIIDTNGLIKRKQSVKNGTIFWAESCLLKNKLFIPTSQDILVYDKNSFLTLFKSLESSGQFYICADNNFLSFTESNAQKIKVFDLQKNSLIWESIKIPNRIFSPPIIINEYIFASDMKENIYKFNLRSSEPEKILKIETGVVSSIISVNNKLLFIANNGWLYEINTGSFDNFKKIVMVDKNPNYNKYLIKKILLTGSELYFSSDTGKLFYYNTIDGEYKFIDTGNSNPLIGTPVMIKNDIFAIDLKSNIYKIRRNFE